MSSHYLWTFCTLFQLYGLCIVSPLFDHTVFFSPHSPTGKKFRSKPQLARYLGNSMDLSSFDFRTGKMIMSKLNKNRQRLRYEHSGQNRVGHVILQDRESIHCFVTQYEKKNDAWKCGKTCKRDVVEKYKH